MNPNKFSGVISSVSLFLIAIVLSLAISCRNQNSTENNQSGNKPKTDTIIQIPGIYMGMLPCADCSGIEYTLTMNPDSSFILKSTYLGKPADHNTFIEAGQWSMVDKGKLLLELPQENLYLKQKGKNLLWLDKQGNEIQSKQNYQLSRIGNFE